MKTMQKTYVKIISRKVLTAAVVTNPSAFESSAETNTSEYNMEIVSSNIHSNVEFKGTDNNTYIFEVSVENPDAQTFTLEVRNDSGVALFSQNYSDANLVEEITLINKELTAHYNFIIKTNNKEPEHTFIVSIATKAASEVEAA
jgi:hypothetical protein